MAYTGDPANVPTDEVRLLISDISLTAPIFTDGEISYFYTRHGNVLKAASAAASVLAAKYAAQVSQSSGEESIQFDQLFQHYKTLAADLLEQHTRGQSSFSVPAATEIKTIQDSIASNFPPRQRISDIAPESFGTNIS
jgi:hypothetical protein